MQLFVRSMTEEYAKQILNWKYVAPYDFYNNEETYGLNAIRLTVAIFNQRAIHLYTKLGFVKKVEFNRDTTEFITMVKKY
ncbi:MAG: family N-acetyltransferase [Neobacillus sp.]|nr:family N-acetyltransferase [Neobacillus sp.]